MDSLPRPRRGLAARILSVVVIVPMLIAACSGGPGAPAADNPNSVVQAAIAKIGAKDVAGLSALACAGQQDKIQQELGMSGDLASAMPGVDTQALMDSVTLDTSALKLGDAVVTGDNATVPVSGSMKITFDKEKLKPIIKKVMEAQGGGISLTDEQIDQFLTQMGGAQDIPLDESIALKKENGAWKICDASGDSDGAAPSASSGY